MTDYQELKARYRRRWRIENSVLPWVHTEIKEPTKLEEFTIGDIFYWDSKHMGFSYWVLVHPPGGLVGHEILPQQMDPRWISFEKMLRKGDYYGRLMPSAFNHGFLVNKWLRSQHGPSEIG